MKRSFLHLTSAGLLALATATAGCNREEASGGNAQAMALLPDLPATIPLASGEAGDYAYAPGVSDLPDAAPLPLGRIADPQQAYGYADAAYSYADAIGDAPPDYAFDYGDVDPWAWQGEDESLMFAEPIDDGYRYYYYRPGAEEPYFVRDPYYAYGFAGAALAVIYAADGGIVPYADYGPRGLYAARYFVRGRQLRNTWRRAPRRAVYASRWIDRRPIMLASRERWGAGRLHQPAWGAFHAANASRYATYWRGERVRREADSRRLAAWRDDGFRTPPPPRAIPAAWRDAGWARDDRRYRPAGDNIREDLRRDREQRALADRREARQIARLDGRQDERAGTRTGTERTRREQALVARERRADAGRADQRQAERARDTAEQRRAAQRRVEQRGAEQRRQAERVRQDPQAQRQEDEPGRAAREAQRRTIEQRQAERRQQQSRERERVVERPQPSARQEQRRAAEERRAERAPRDRQREAVLERQAREGQRQAAEQRQAERAAREGQRAAAQQRQAERVQQQAREGPQRQAERAAREGQRQAAQQRQAERAQAPARQPDRAQAPARDTQRAAAREQRQERRAERRGGE